MQSASFPPPSLDDLHARAISLAERARTYFENEGVADRNSLDEEHRVSFSMQRLRITTRLLAVFGSLAEARGPLREVGPGHEGEPGDRGGGTSPLLPTYVSTIGLPAKVRELCEESVTLEQMTVERFGNSPIGTVAELYRLIQHALAPEL